MNEEYLMRRSLASLLGKELKQYLDGLLLVGSVAHSPRAVNSRSDIDLVGIGDFSKLDFEAVTSVVRGTHDPVMSAYASSRKANVVIVKGWAQSSSIHLILWDQNAFDVVSGCHENPNHYFQYSRDGCNEQVLRNLEGKERSSGVQEWVASGSLYWLYSFMEDETGIFLGKQARTLLLCPEFLWDPVRRVSNQVASFYDELRRRIHAHYGSKPVSLLNVMMDKNRERISDNARVSLENFF